MNEIIQQVFTGLTINPVVIALVIAGGFFQNAYLKPWIIFKKQDSGYNSGIRTLLVGAIFTIIYTIILKRSGEWKAAPGEFFISWAIATSIYQVFIYPFLKKKIDNIVPPVPDDQKTNPN